MKYRTAAIAAGISGLLAAISFCTPALAQEPESPDTAAAPAEAVAGTGVLDGRFYVSPMFSYLLADSDRLTDDGLGGTFAFGKGITDNLALEISGFYLQADSNTAASSDTAKLYGYGANLLVFPRNQFRNAYGLLGVTYDETKDHPGSPANFNGVGYNAGLGYLLPLGWLGAALRVEALFHLDSHDEENAGAGGKSEFYDGLFNAGLFIPIGAKPEPAPIAPEPVAVVAPIVSVDSDGDGVPDDRDQCPGTAQGTLVDSVGCPLKPPCPTPAAGEPITLEGCSAGDVVVLHGVTFEFDRATLTPNAKTILDGVSDSLQAAAAIKVELGGHTDSVGTDAYNLKLSDRRAITVREYLIGRGVDSTRMTSHGYGEAQPIADNSTDEGRELNRRVELKIQP